MRADELYLPGGYYQPLSNVEAGVSPQMFDSWWEAESPDDAAREWLVTLYEPDIEGAVVLSQRAFTGENAYYEAMNYGESQIPAVDVDITPVREATREP